MPGSRPHPLIDVRADFPVFDRGFAYLDSAATSQKPNSVIEAIDSYYRELERQRAPRRVRAGPGGHRAVRGRARARRGVRRRRAGHHDLHPQRHRGDQPRGLLVGPRARRRGRRGADHPHGAPLQHRARGSCSAPSAARACATCTCPSEGQLSLDELDEVLAERPREAGGGGPRLQRAGHDQPGRRDRRARARRRRGVGGRRLPGGAPDAGERGGRRRGLLRLDRPQGAGPHRASACCTAAASCSSRCGRSSAAAT